MGISVEKNSMRRAIFSNGDESQIPIGLSEKHSQVTIGFLVLDSLKTVHGYGSIPIDTFLVGIH